MNNTKKNTDIKLREYYARKPKRKAVAPPPKRVKPKKPRQIRHRISLHDFGMSLRDNLY